MIKCEYCRANNKDIALECRKCGAPLPDETSFNGWINDESKHSDLYMGMPCPSPYHLLGVDGESVVEFNSDGSAIFRSGDAKLVDEFVKKYPDTVVSDIAPDMGIMQGGGILKWLFKS